VNLNAMSKVQRAALHEVLDSRIRDVEEAPRSSDEWPKDILTSEGFLFLVVVRDTLAAQIGGGS
jgi:hypothetical protein